MILQEVRQGFELIGGNGRQRGIGLEDAPLWDAREAASARIHTAPERRLAAAAMAGTAEAAGTGEYAADEAVAEVVGPMGCPQRSIRRLPA